MIRWVAAGIFGVGLVAGTALDEVPERAPERAGSYWVLEADFHLHTRFSDGFLFPFDLVIAARRQGLDVIAVTEHNTIVPAQMARWFAELTGGRPMVIVGEEITTRDYHVIALGLGETVPGGLPLREALGRVKAQSGVAIAAHPTRSYWPILDQALDLFDGAEVMHPMVRERRVGGGSWRAEDLTVFYRRLVESRGHAAAIGSSDHHVLKSMGSCRTLIFAEEPTEAGVLQALRTGRTLAQQNGVPPAGDPELIALYSGLAREETDRNRYAAGSLADSVFRVAGWGALVALIGVRGGRRGRRSMPVSAESQPLR